MHVLLIKTSSLGDVVHALPAVTDAARAIPGIRFDWVVEEAFAEIPCWHPAVDRVIPVAIRRWRKSLVRTWLSGEWRRFTRELVQRHYDLTIDAQGLIKSAMLSRYATVPVHGLDRHSAREPLASRFYTDPHAVARDQHAVQRMRELFARALGYPIPTDDGDYGLDLERIRTAAGPRTGLAAEPGRYLQDAIDDEGAGAEPMAGSSMGQRHPVADRPYLVFLHGTTWVTKHWPEAYWRTLLTLADDAGWAVRLPWGNDAEKSRANRLAAGLTHVSVLPRLTLSGIAAELGGARACVAVDTGLGHLAAALAVPTISLYGPTNPGFTGTWGPGQTHVASDFACAPCLKKQCGYTPSDEDRRRFDVASESPLCFTRLGPERVWQALAALITDAPRTTGQEPI